MNRFLYLLYGLVVVILSTSANLGSMDRRASAPSAWSGGSGSSGGGFGGGGHK